MSELTGDVKLQTLAGEIYKFDWSQTCKANSLELDDSVAGNPTKHAAQAAMLLADMKSTATDGCGLETNNLRPIVDANSQIKCYTPDVGPHARARAL